MIKSRSVSVPKRKSLRVQL